MQNKSSHTIRFLNQVSINLRLQITLLRLPSLPPSFSPFLPPPLSPFLPSFEIIEFLPHFLLHFFFCLGTLKNPTPKWCIFLLVCSYRPKAINTLFSDDKTAQEVHVFCPLSFSPESELGPRSPVAFALYHCFFLSFACVYTGVHVYARVCVCLCMCESPVLLFLPSLLPSTNKC